ncbi:MAG: type II toxin-antitoxin system VapC family toxin [Desulfococcaceae bacterium]
MIVLDAHVWTWWTHDPDRLSASQIQIIREHETDIPGVGAVSVWEIARLAEHNRLEFPGGIDDWLRQALSCPGIRPMGLSAEIAVESTRLSGEFHRDPADQIIVATARDHGVPLVSSGRKIIAYPHVATVS